jgi:ankyrin repeat domain-containing protein 50
MLRRFLHASLQLAALQMCTTIGEVREILASFPQKIKDVYQDTWRRILRHSTATANGIRAQNCIIWVVHSPKSLTVAELQHLTAVCLETQTFDAERIVHIDTLLALCHGLLVVDKETNLVRLVRE